MAARKWTITELHDYSAHSWAKGPTNAFRHFATTDLNAIASVINAISDPEAPIVSITIEPYQTTHIGGAVPDITHNPDKPAAPRWDLSDMPHDFGHIGTPDDDETGMTDNTDEHGNCIHPGLFAPNGSKPGDLVGCPTCGNVVDIQDL